MNIKPSMKRAETARKLSSVASYLAHSSTLKVEVTSQETISFMIIVIVGDAP
jgi:ABC-type transport system involved in cytochrome c biogenesis ATPase subunit